MSKIGWFAAGIGLGALAVVQLRDNPKAQAALEEAIDAAKEFGNAVALGYQEREAELAKPATSAKPRAAAKPRTRAKPRTATKK
ncbi:MAG: hypothetical protein RL068_928 [Actinomycetota bacterium]|jgi:hypothetical protein